MPTVHINGIPYEANEGERLSELLTRCGIAADHPCGGRGTCRKCIVTVNGREELSCRYILTEDVTVETVAPAAIQSPVDTESTVSTVHMDTASAATASAATATVQTLVLDIGTTTLAMARLDSPDGSLSRHAVATANNPQRAFGADILSRISYARENGVSRLTDVLIEAIRGLMTELGVERADRLFVAGNTTMLHLFFGVDPTSIGTAPYTPTFLAERITTGDACALPMVREVRSLPCISAFVGADLVAGLHYVGFPPAGKYRLLIDLGTNAEILLIHEQSILCTAAAAGPCFEGASISCGMSATSGAICSYDADGAYRTIGDAPPIGICGTGLVDAVAALLETDVVDETGYMAIPRFFLADSVSLVQQDIREYQLAKSAIRAATEALLHRSGIGYDAIDRLYISGGFAATVDIPHAVRTGLLPAELADRCVPVGNSSLLGTVRHAVDGSDLKAYVARAHYVDLSADPYFSERFMEEMLFE